MTEILDTVNQELDRLISRRASADLAEDPDTKEELWKASVRVHNARRREVMRKRGQPSTRDRPSAIGAPWRT